MTDQLNALDLDALERGPLNDIANCLAGNYAGQLGPGLPLEHLDFLDRTCHALIKRLREAERRDKIAAILHADFIDKIEKLERVREAASELVSPCEHERGFCIAHGTVRLPCPVADLVAALAAVEAAPLTENPTEHKAGSGLQ